VAGRAGTLIRIIGDYSDAAELCALTSNRIPIELGGEPQRGGAAALERSVPERIHDFQQLRFGVDN
jgi:hypothetical protein